MDYKLKLLAVSAVSVLLSAGSALAQDQDRDRLQTRDPDTVQAPDQERTQDQIRDRDIYGSQMMTPQEHEEYRERMRAATTAQEREQIRAEHHALMQERAKERGVALPPEPRIGAGPRAPGGPGAGGAAGGGRR